MTILIIIDDIINITYEDNNNILDKSRMDMVNNNNVENMYSNTKYINILIIMLKILILMIF